MQLKAQFTGNVTNEPEIRTVGAKNTALKELNIAINHDKKNKETGEYERTGDTTWVTVKLWGDRANEEFGKGDLVEFDGTVVEKVFPRKDGTEGRRLESDYVASLTVKYRKSGASSQPVAAEEDPF
jgi:single-stranded DNA-binding protein